MKTYNTDNVFITLDEERLTKKPDEGNKEKPVFIFQRPLMTVDY
jgi:hypothetical protein